jgi:hypothetical protein
LAVIGYLVRVGKVEQVARVFALSRWADCWGARWPEGR